MTSFGPAAPTIVSPSRWRWLGAGVVGAWITIAGAASAADIGAFLVVLLIGAPLSGFAFWWGVRRTPALVIDEDGLVEGRSGRRVLWGEVSELRAVTNRDSYGESHDLIVSLVQRATPAPRRLITTNANATDEIEIGLDWLSMPWTEIVSAVERHSGRSVRRARGRERITSKSAPPTPPDFRDARGRYHRMVFLTVPAASAGFTSIIGVATSDVRWAMGGAFLTAAAVLTLSEDRFANVSRRRRMTYASLSGLLTAAVAAVLILLVAGPPA